MFSGEDDFTFGVVVKSFGESSSGPLETFGAPSPSSRSTELLFWTTGFDSNQEKKA